ncbi:MAG: HEPN domain-containing protein, partial [Chloroflexi bacterium]|nr:HEPN domain-containing protein [Chloroflexota bacterium]
MTSFIEIKLYIERAYAALQQSKDILDLGYHDVATSRAYYAMFYAATALLLSQGISRSKHSGVHSAFGQHFIKPGLIEPEYGRMLTNAFNVRLDSDYEIY